MNAMALHVVRFQGAWKPSLNVSTLLTSIRLLMSEPNAEDGLMADIVRNAYVCSTRNKL